MIPQSLKNLEKWMDRDRYKQVPPPLCPTHLHIRVRRSHQRRCQLSLADRKKIWAPTFGYRERLRCFLAAPVTAHNLSATLYTGILLHFTATSTSGFFAPYSPICRESWLGMT